jgi:antitoxin MazE
MRVSKWGNSLAIRIPAAIASELKLKAGDEIDVRVAGPAGFVVEREMTRKEAIQVMRKGGLELPAGYKLNREEANGRPRVLRH